jgi:hypothetical protein
MDWGPLNSVCVAAFGESVTFQATPPAGAVVSITAVVTQPRTDGEWPGAYMGVCFDAVQAALLESAPARGDRVVIGGENYAVFDIRKDGTGWYTLLLEKARD